jgi:hypothetical protein
MPSLLVTDFEMNRLTSTKHEDQTEEKNKKS